MSKQVLLDRRGFLRGGASVAMAAVLGSSETLAAEAGEKPKIRPLEGKMDYESIRKRAREMMMPRCYVCPECNGRGPASVRFPVSAAWAQAEASRPTMTLSPQCSSTAV